VHDKLSYSRATLVTDPIEISERNNL
jgi:hypothetical protein